MPRKKTDEQFFKALDKALTKGDFWGGDIQLHPLDRRRLHQRKFSEGEFLGRVVKHGGGGSFLKDDSTHTMLFGGRPIAWDGMSAKRVTLWDGKTVKEGWMGVEGKNDRLTMINLFPVVARKPKPKKERLTRFDRDFEV